ncbi:hypothetical protein AJ935_04785 [Campylobacter sp. BCW_6876]|nr:hypothetical protein AJ935_04785 [Campylobacter sp. BCW_6876]
MYNPNSAIERVKNHLAYKLGQAMIDFTNNGGGYIALFKKLYKIKKQHKKEQKIYQQTIQVFPQLKYPSLEACSDYKQALRYKFHLSYMLGEVLIKAYQTWYTGGGFKLKNNIKKANKEFQIFREIFREFDQINSSILEGLIDNKQLFLKEFSRIKNILKIHQDYKAILDNIFHNFNYFIQNFDLIEEWLLSDDFNERYKKENHPYPSLLDPKKLNDKNEKINYHNIPAELAWEMNLPLPDKYKFVFMGYGLSGHAALYKFFNRLIFCINWKNYTIKDIYENRQESYLFIPIHDLKDIKNIKIFLYKLNNQPVVILLRDPIERLKTAINHGSYKNNKQKAFDRYEINDSIDIMLDRVSYTNVNDRNKGLITWLKYICFDYSIFIQIIKTKIIFIDAKNIMPNKAFDTMIDLSKQLNINPPQYHEKKYLCEIKNSVFKYILPITLHYKNIVFFITLKQEKPNKNIEPNFINHNILKLVAISIKVQDAVDFNFIMKKEKDYLISFFINFLNKLEIKVKNIKSLYIKEEEVLSILRSNFFLRNELYVKMFSEYKELKKHCPDIVASWKYYQEFEKMCKELDG